MSLRAPKNRTPSIKIHHKSIKKLESSVMGMILHMCISKAPASPIPSQASTYIWAPFPLKYPIDCPRVSYRRLQSVPRQPLFQLPGFEAELTPHPFFQLPLLRTRTFLSIHPPHTDAREAPFGIYLSLSPFPLQLVGFPQSHLRPRGIRNGEHAAVQRLREPHFYPPPPLTLFHYLTSPHHTHQPPPAPVGHIGAWCQPVWPPTFPPKLPRNTTPLTSPVRGFLMSSC